MSGTSRSEYLERVRQSEQREKSLKKKLDDYRNSANYHSQSDYASSLIRQIDEERRTQSSNRDLAFDRDTDPW